MHTGYMLLSKLCIVGKFGKNAFCVFRFGADLDRIKKTVLRHVTFNVCLMLKPNSQGKPFWCSCSGSFESTQSYKHLTHTSEMAKRVWLGCFKTFGLLKCLSGRSLSDHLSPFFFLLIRVKQTPRERKRLLKASSVAEQNEVLAPHNTNLVLPALWQILFTRGNGQ